MLLHPLANMLQALIIGRFEAAVTPKLQPIERLTAPVSPFNIPALVPSGVGRSRSVDGEAISLGKMLSK
jgi:hypothetical protein